MKRIDIRQVLKNETDESIEFLILLENSSTEDINGKLTISIQDYQDGSQFEKILIEKRHILKAKKVKSTIITMTKKEIERSANISKIRYLISFKNLENKNLAKYEKNQLFSEFKEKPSRYEKQKESLYKKGKDFKISLDEEKYKKKIKHRKVGYLPEYLSHLFSQYKDVDGLDIDWITHRLSSFLALEINYFDKIHFMDEKLKKLLYIYHNLIIRGDPTYPTHQLEQFLISSASKEIPIKEADNKQRIVFRDRLPPDLKDAWFKAIIKILMVRDYRTKDYNDEMDSQEERFFYKLLEEKIGSSACKLIECQRPFFTLVKYTDTNFFRDQRVDFSIETGRTKLIIEIDGEQHFEKKQLLLDQRRDSILRERGWEVIRIPASKVREEQIENELIKIEEYFKEDPYIKATIENNEQQEQENDLSRIRQAAMQIALVPIAVARVQWALVNALIDGQIKTSNEIIRLAIIERDIPCAVLAVWDFFKSLDQLRLISGIKWQFPKIELKIKKNSKFSNIIETKKIQKEILDLNISISDLNLDELNKKNFDLIIDVSILQTNLKKLGYSVGKNSCVLLSSVNSPRITHQQIKSTTPIEYNIDEKKEKNLLFFLRWIFRKKGFWEGQFVIIQRALSTKDVIGLLPTGAGKSLCYQLSALLQPGTTIIIDPLISLMEDQVDNLKKYKIDKIDNISSVLGEEERDKREEKIDKFTKGSYLMFFISPERLQIPDFRDKISEMCAKVSVPYVVIDEVHCVSEWGHDFRPSYLGLADKARKICSYRGYKPAVIALTGTASSVVLDDVQREIDITEEEARISPTTFDRPELEFDIVSCDSSQKIPELRKKLHEMPKKFGLSMKDFFDGNNAGIIFCPHVGGRFGIVSVKNQITKFDLNIPNIVMYSGRAPSNQSREEWDEYKKTSQRVFKENISPLIVATKAFGMGIDKENIRYIIHYNMTPSLEAYYQEAGRAGRDKSRSLCSIIFSGNPTKWKDTFDPNLSAEKVAEKFQNSKIEDDIARMLFFHTNSWKGAGQEFNYIMEIVKKKIIPNLNNLEKDKTMKIHFQFYNRSNKDVSRAKIEKALHRLSILGIVADYTLDHRSSLFEAVITNRSDKSIKSALLKYIGRYRTVERLNEYSDRIDSSKYSTVLEKCLRILVEFIYEEIEKKRRRATLTMAEAAQSACEGKSFRKFMLDYLETSEFTKRILALSKRMEPDEWIEIASNVEDINSAHRLLGNCRRELESNPDHPGLLMLSSYARLLASDETARDEFERFIKTLMKSPLSENDRRNTLNRILELISEQRPKMMNSLCRIAIREIPDRLIARMSLKYTDINSEVGNMALRIMLGVMLEKIILVRRHSLGGD